MVLYCLALFLGFDFLYSAVTMGQEKAHSARIADPVYDHGFAANFDGYDIWGEARYRSRIISASRIPRSATCL